MVFDFDTFHILSADVKDAIHFRIEECGGIIMGHCLHFTVVQQEGCLHQGFPVSGGTGTDNMYILRQLFVDFL